MQLSLQSRQSRDWAPTFFLLLGWSIFIVWVWALRWNWLVGVTALPLIIVFAAKIWSIPLAAFSWILISLVWSQFSIAPMGFLFVCGFGVFLLCQYVTSRFEITHRLQLALMVFAVSFVFDFVQWLGLIFFIENPLSWWYVPRALWIALVHSGLALLAAPLYERLAVKK